MKYESSRSMRRERLIIEGFSLIEVILASSLFALLVTALAGAFIFGQESTALAGSRSRAVMLAEEGLEASRNIRDQGFNDLAVGTHGLSISGNQWVFSGTQDTSDIFTRSIEIESVDSKRKMVTSTVNWQQTESRTGTVSLVTRLTSWLQSVSGWAQPIQESNLDFSGAEDGLKIQVLGNYVYIVRNDGTPDFLVIDISNTESPSLVASIGLAGIPTNIFVSGNYAYVSSQNDSQELQIIDISTPTSPVVVGTFNAIGTADTLGVYSIGTTVYVVRQSSAADEFIIIDASIASVPVLIGSLNLAATGYEIWVSGTKAYIASGANNSELQVVDITVPATPAMTGTGFNIAGNSDALTIAGTGNIIFLGRLSNIYIIDVSSPTAPLSLSTFAGTGTINDIALNFGNANTYIYFVTANSNAEFELFDITIPSIPTSIGHLNLTAFSGIAYDAVKDRAFIVGKDDNSEFAIIKPQ